MAQMVVVLEVVAVAALLGFSVGADVGADMTTSCAGWK